MSTAVLLSTGCNVTSSIKGAGLRYLGIAAGGMSPRRMNVKVPRDGKGALGLALTEYPGLST